MKAYPNLKPKKAAKGKIKSKKAMPMGKMPPKANPFMAAMKSAGGKGKM